jgi:lipid II:glycine glycyltransferase (peptidoglycan interpeptide bridge formation enzyme)
MITRELEIGDKESYNRVTNHPLQSWEWGEFREKTGVKVIRIGTFDGKNLVSGFQITIHPIPYLPFTIGYFPKGEMPDEAVLNALSKIGQENNCIFIQIEPNVIQLSAISHQLSDNLIPSARPLFTKYTFHLDLTQTEEQLLANMHPKTRYNIRVAQKHGVTIVEDNSPEAFEAYWKLTQETTERQGFYAHSYEYHKNMWDILSRVGIAHLLTARINGEILVAWILFLFKDVLYYPYGASSMVHKEMMASNLMMWEAIRWGKTQGAKLFDMWGTPGPNPKPTDPYFGFHRFKLGYGPKLVEFVGSYDLVLMPVQYKIYTLLNKLRWHLLKIKAKVAF